MNLKEKIKSWFDTTTKDAVENDYYRPKLFGKSKSVTYEIDGLVKSYCQVTAWANGEGFDVSFETLANTKTGHFEHKRISLHTDELDVFFACLDHLKYF